MKPTTFRPISYEAWSRAGVTGGGWPRFRWDNLVVDEIKLAQEESERGHLHQTSSPYHDQTPGIPSVSHLQANYPAET